MLTHADDETEVAETVLQNRWLAGRMLRQIYLPGDALVLGIRREGDVIVPHGGTELHLGDTVIVVGSRDYVEESVRLLSQSFAAAWRKDRTGVKGWRLPESNPAGRAPPRAGLVDQPADLRFRTEVDRGGGASGWPRR